MGSRTGAKGESRIAKERIDMAAERLQKERFALALLSASAHLKAACRALVRMTFLYPEAEWYSTSILYRQYCWCLQKEARPLGYRRVSELLGELENQRLAISRAVSKGTASSTG